MHLATSGDGLRLVFFQGHPEYDTISLLKEYKREVLLYAARERDDYPPFPKAYFDVRETALLNEYRCRVDRALRDDSELPAFPERLIEPPPHTAEAVVGNWMGLVYQITNRDRRLPFMEDIDPDNPLGL